MSSFRRMLEVHPDGMQEIFHWSEPDRQFAIEYRQDGDAAVAAAREEAADTGGWSKSRDLQHVGTITPVVLLEMARRYGPEIIKDTRLQRRALDDPEWRYLRIAKVI